MHLTIHTRVVLVRKYRDIFFTDTLCKTGYVWNYTFEEMRRSHKRPTCSKPGTDEKCTSPLQVPQMQKFDGAIQDFVGVTAEEVDGAGKTENISLEQEIDGEKPLSDNIHSTLTPRKGGGWERIRKPVNAWRSVFPNKRATQLLLGGPPAKVTSNFCMWVELMADCNGASLEMAFTVRPLGAKHHGFCSQKPSEMVTDARRVGLHPWKSFVAKVNSDRFRVQTSGKASSVTKRKEEHGVAFGSVSQVLSDRTHTEKGLVFVVYRKLQPVYRGQGPKDYSYLLPHVGRLADDVAVFPSPQLHSAADPESPHVTRINMTLHTIPICENPGVTLLGIEVGSPWWEASSLTAQPPRPLRRPPPILRAAGWQVNYHVVISERPCTKYRNVHPKRIIAFVYKTINKHESWKPYSMQVGFKAVITITTIVIRSSSRSSQFREGNYLTIDVMYSSPQMTPSETHSTASTGFLGDHRYLSQCRIRKTIYVAIPLFLHQKNSKIKNNIQNIVASRIRSVVTYGGTVYGTVDEKSLSCGVHSRSYGDFLALMYSLMLPTITISSTSSAATVQVAGSTTEQLSCLPEFTGEPRLIPGRITSDFRKWESCRTIPLVGRFSRGSLATPPFHSGAAPFSPHANLIDS
ncbi:hypothetical protein PR048_005574 [Dryococelus australis]|uniref:Uncharacterized protein n=1 Tax=Dryococelus australis TaxID=614101 RepID=A0ABQ9I8J8_9NEOP|nr:hypothetical protein PR048_005574 [Dryococelus australis]